MKKEELFFNRELSWLEFNQRVLDEALNPAVPLLERVSFLSITSSNLDEFFMVRVGGLEILVAERSRKPDMSGMTPAQQLKEIGRRVHRMAADQYTCLNTVLLPALAAEGIRRVPLDALDASQLRHMESYFNDHVFPVVTPMAVSARGGDFPLLVNLGLNVAVRLKAPKGNRALQAAIVPIAARMDRFVALPARHGFAYVLIEDVMRLFCDRLFPGRTVMECVPFRITRNADMSVREDMASDLMAEMQNVLAWRKTSGCVRLELEAGASQTMQRFLSRALGVRSANVYETPGPLDLAAFRRIVAVGGHANLRYTAWPPQPSPDLDMRKSIFGELKARNVLLSLPYEAFDPVVKLVEEAADDPDVLAIKQILYRTSADSPIVTALVRAAKAGKYVTVLVELKARFDEARNIAWAQKMEEEGVQVIYGIRGLKTHAKVCIVVRREPEGIVRYCHFGTGNYNDRTARLYSDVGYMTCDPDLGTDASAFFNAICGHSEPLPFLKLSAAPIGLHERLVELIDSETERARQGQKAMIMAKMNSLVDPDIINALYRASHAGVQIRLNIRGICCLRPGMKKHSRHIRVISIVDRFLEHSRVFYFYQGGEEDVYISSADWMPRNLRRRIELMTPVDDTACRRRLVAMLETYFKDTAKARELTADGSYQLCRPTGRKQPFRSQEELYREACERVAQAEKMKRTVFEPHRPPRRKKKSG